MIKLWRALIAYLVVAALAAPMAVGIRSYLEDAGRRGKLTWQNPHAFWLLGACALLAWVLFHLRAHRGATMAFSRVADMRRAGPGAVSYLADLPSVLRILAVAAIAVALARPQTWRTITTEIDSVDIMIVLDLSKSMDERDMRRGRPEQTTDRLDAAQRVIRRFVASRQGDRVGLVVFAQQAMLQCPLTSDMEVVDRVVADLKIDDIPALGTAIGDGLGMAMSYLRRSDAKSKIVILLSDGDNNVSTQMTPRQSAEAAQAAGVKVFTVLVGSQRSGSSVNPDTLMTIAQVTDGKFFEATDFDDLRDSFDDVRKTLQTTKRQRTEKKKDRELFMPLVGLAVALLFLEMLLSATRFRRFP